MAKKKQKPKKQIETLTHEQASRTNIPTAEFESVMGKEQRQAKKVDYPRPGKDSNGAMQSEINRRNVDLDPQLVWRGKDTQNWSDLIAQAPPLFIQEKVHPKALIDDLRRQTEANEIAKKLKQTPPPLSQQADLFADFNGLPDDPQVRTEFYQHDSHWTNRMILGDSLSVMASLAEREGLRGKVQCIYLDPPYGIKFNSNFQWSTTSRDVKDGKSEHITREPEQVKAFRDTWRDGIHSYLTYLRDRLTVARDLLTESGSIFVQIGDENVHRVRALMDEVFGDENHASTIHFQTTTGQASDILPRSGDHVLWYAKTSESLKSRQLYREKNLSELASYSSAMSVLDGSTRKLNAAENVGAIAVEEGWRVYSAQNLRSQEAGSSETRKFVIRGREFDCGASHHWKTNPNPGIRRLASAGRVQINGSTPNYIRFVNDYPVVGFTNKWDDTAIAGFSGDTKRYVVETPTKVIQRCLLLATDPGDLVLDPTCGSGTTAYVAEQWGRRWITIDTSRVSLALARARIMGARYPYYLLEDSPEGKAKEAELGTVDSEQRSVTSEEGYSNTDHQPLATDNSSATGTLRLGFVYERVPHITLKAIANNSEIDTIWEKYEEKLAPLREKITAVVGDQWLVDSRKDKNHTVELPNIIQEWEMPRQRPDHWPQATDHLLSDFWHHRIARQKKIDASIAAKADYEYLYDKPYEDKKKVRVAGPFTVESLSPHRVLGVDADDNLIDPLEKMAQASGAGASFGEIDPFLNMVLENLKTAGVQQAHKQDKITFTSIKPHPGEYICAEARYEQSPDNSVGRASRPSSAEGGNNEDNKDGGRDARPTKEYRAGIFVGPEFGTISRQDLVVAAREAADMGFDVLIACGFNYEAHASEFSKLGGLPILKARMNADLHMADDLKNTGKGNLFVIFGEPDISVISGQWLVTSSGKMVTNYEYFKQLSGLESLAEINRLGSEDLSGFKKLPHGRKVRPDQPDSPSGSISPIEHSRGSSSERDGRVSTVSKHSDGVAGGGRNPNNFSTASGNDDSSTSARSSGNSSGDREDAQWSKTLATCKELTHHDFPLKLTTDHWAQVTIHGVDVFHPSTGKVQSDDTSGIACWFIDTDYNEESFFVRQAYFLGANDPYQRLKTTLKAEIDKDAWETLHSAVSREFAKPQSGRIAVKVINHLGDEVMKVFKVE